MSTVQQSGFESEVEEYEIADYSDDETSDILGSEYDSGDEEFDLVGYLNNETHESDRAAVSLEQAIYSGAIQSVCRDSIKTGKPLTSFRLDFIQFLERIDVTLEQFKTDELEVYINAMIEKNNEVSDYIKQLGRVGAGKTLVHEVTDMKQNVLRRLKKAEEEMIKRFT